MDILAGSDGADLSLVQSSTSLEGDSTLIGLPPVLAEGEAKGDDIEVEEDDISLTEDEKEAKKEADATYIKKLNANNAVKNLAAMFGKKAAPVEVQFRSRVKVDMSKFAKPAKADYGLKIHKLREWKAERAKELALREESLQEMAVAKVRGFMDAVVIIVKLQSRFVGTVFVRRSHRIHACERGHVLRLPPRWASGTGAWRTRPGRSCTRRCT